MSRYFCSVCTAFNSTRCTIPTHNGGIVDMDKNSTYIHHLNPSYLHITTIATTSLRVGHKGFSSEVTYDLAKFDVEVIIKPKVEVFEPGYFRYVGSDASEHEGAQWFSTKPRVPESWKRANITDA